MQLKLKSGYGIKNIVVGFTWSVSIVLSLKKVSLTIFTFYFLKLFINSSIFDIKDKDVDEIRTLPKVLDEKSFKLLLTSLNLIAHSVILLKNEIIALSSFILTQVSIHLDERVARRIIDVEPALSSILYILLWNFLLHG